MKIQIQKNWKLKIEIWEERKKKKRKKHRKIEKKKVEKRET